MRILRIGHGLSKFEVTTVFVLSSCVVEGYYQYQMLVFDLCSVGGICDLFICCLYLSLLTMIDYIYIYNMCFVPMDCFFNLLIFL